jgi:hypothetical protein
MRKLFLLACTITFFIGFNNGTAFSQSGMNALLEYCTGTWCPWCPCGDDIAHNIQAVRPNTMVLAYHGPLNYGGDPFTTFNGYSIISLLGFSAYPTGIVQRASGIISRGSWAGWVNVASTDYYPAISYAVTKSYNTSTRQLNVQVISTALRNIDTSVYINLVLYEDKILYTQAGNSSCPGSSTYIHDWVVRNMVNGASGELLKTATWTQGTTAQKNWTTTIDNGWAADNIKVAVFAYLGSVSASGGPVVQTWKESLIPTGVGSPSKIPSTYVLSQNYPNPFNPTTNIKFSIPKDGNASLKIYDMLGNEVATYLEGFVKAGEYNAVIDGSNWSSGVYFYRLSTSEFTDTKKMTLVK